MGILSRLGLKRAETIELSRSLGGKIIKVGPGESLQKIAAREYGDENLWERIYEANKAKLKDPDALYPGMELQLP